MPNAETKKLHYNSVYHHGIDDKRRVQIPVKWRPAELETEFKTLAAATDQKVGALIHPSRLAVSGRPVGPSLYHLLEVLGKDRVLRRLERAEKQFAS